MKNVFSVFEVAHSANKSRWASLVKKVSDTTIFSNEEKEVLINDMRKMRKTASILKQVVTIVLTAMICASLTVLTNTVVFGTVLGAIICLIGRIILDPHIDKDLLENLEIMFKSKLMLAAGERLHKTR